MYDVIVIGAGPAGYEAALLAARRGQQVVLFNGDKVGGVCLNEGCVPSKTLLHSAKTYLHAQNSSAFGVICDNISIDQAQVCKRKQKVVKKLVAGIKSQLKSAGVTIVDARAEIISVYPELIVRADNNTYSGHKILIATGSTVAIPPIAGAVEALDQGFALTSREILDLTTIPESLTVIGGGVIGLEMAMYFASIGSEVTVIEMLDKVGGPSIDRELSETLAVELGKLGIKFILGGKVSKILSEQIEYQDADGAVQELRTEKVLLAAGRRSRGADVFAAELRDELQLNPQAPLSTDSSLHLQTSEYVFDNIYAIGDVNGQVMLAHTAYKEAAQAVAEICGEFVAEIDYQQIPAIIYTDPEVAWVGLTLEQAQTQGLDAVEFKLPMTYSGRYQAEVERGSGFVKLVYERESKRLLGCHILGSYASEIVAVAVTMLEQNYTLKQIAETVFPHPTVSEIIKLAADQVCSDV